MKTPDSSSLPSMPNLLSLHRSETEQLEPADFLAHFPAFVLQYLDDSPRHDRRKALTATAFSPEVAARKQREGCGVYFAPNAFDGHRRLENLLQVRATYLDLDVAKERDGLSTATIEGRKERALLDLLVSEARPHAVIETKNGLQPLWLVRPERIDHAVRRFREAMAMLLRRFGGDPGAKDLDAAPATAGLPAPEDPRRALPLLRCSGTSWTASPRRCRRSSTPSTPRRMSRTAPCASSRRRWSRSTTRWTSPR